VDSFRLYTKLMDVAGLGDSVCRILALYSIISHLISESQV
jgi:hypothetical protein